MSYIFIDESGDLGTKKSSSNYFVMAGIKVDNYQKLDRIIRKIRKYGKADIGYTNEIKSSIIPADVKRNVLKRLNKIDYESYIVILDKDYRYKFDYKYNNNFLYDALASELAKLITINNPSFIFVDKYKNKEEEINTFNKKFSSHLNNFKKYPITIKHVNSFSYKGIQVADVISWSAFQSAEYNNNEFLNLVNNKIIKKL